MFDLVHKLSVPWTKNCPKVEEKDFIVIQTNYLCFLCEPGF